MPKIKRKPHRIRKKRSIWKNRFFRLSILSLIFLGSVFYLTVFSSFFQIKEIKIFGEQGSLTKKLKSTIEQQVKKKLLFFPTKSIFLADLSGLSEILLEKFPQLGKIEIKRKLPDGLEVSIEQRTAIGLWCAKDCYLIDKDGKEFGQGALNSTTGLDLIIQSQEKPQKEQVMAILEINKIIKKDFAIELKEFVILSDRLTAKTAEGWEIYFDVNGDVGQQLFNLEALLEKELASGIQKNLQYIDLRFGNRLYYK